MLHIICQYLVCWTHVVFCYRTAGQIASGEFNVEWDDETREKLQTVVDESDQVAFCGDNDVCQ